MGFQETLAQDRRLVLLRVLANSAGYASNEYALATMCAALGHAVGHERLRQDLAWLQDAGLLRVGDTAGVQIATLNARGAEVAAGTVQTPGVARPRPAMPQ